jgi:colanic acid biosynthesis protein WcaH
MQLDEDTFLTVVEATPLVSVDLLVRDDTGAVLLGWRTNRPAQGCWFVPGGRIQKNERIADALRRIAVREVGHVLERADLFGVFDHFYPDNYFDRAGISTHYVVIAYAGRLPEGATEVADDQHAELRWWPVEALLAAPDVHEHTKRYFRPAPREGQS